MTDYKKLYFKLFNEVTALIENLQQAQQHAEERFLSEEEAEDT